MTPRSLVTAWEIWHDLAADYPEFAKQFQPPDDADGKAIGKSCKKLRNAVVYQQYLDGRSAGSADGKILLEHAGTGQHTLDAYLRIKQTYEDAIYTDVPTPWQIGYGEGLDFIAAQAQQDYLTADESDYSSWGDFDRPATEAM